MNKYMRLKIWIILLGLVLVLSYVHSIDDRVRIDYCELAFSPYDFISEANLREGSEINYQLQLNRNSSFVSKESYQIPDEYSFSIWVKGLGSNQIGEDIYLMGFDNTTAIRSVLMDGTSKLGIVTRNASNESQYNIIDKEVKHLDNQWRHVVVTTKNISNLETNVTVYLDGEKVLEDRMPKQLQRQSKIRIGSWSTSWGRFSGLVDEARVYNRTLSNAEVKSLFNKNEVSNGLFFKKSFEELDLFKSWNETIGEGIFVKIENTEKNFGKTPPKYTYNYFSNSKTVFNEFNSSLGIVEYPIIKTNVSSNKYYYSRCYFIMGSDKSVVIQASNNHLQGFFTNAFNLTKGFLDKDNVTNDVRATSKYPGSNFLNYVNRLATENEVDKLEGQFYPNTHPHQVFKQKITNYPTGYYTIEFGELMLEESRLRLVTFPSGVRFYINNTSPNFKLTDYLIPHSEGIHTVKGKNQEFSGKTSCTPSCLINISRGDTIEVSKSFYNPYNYPLNFSLTSTIYHPGDFQNSYSDIKGPSGKSGHYVHNSTNSNISIRAKETKNVSIKYTFPEDNDYSLPLVYSLFYWKNTYNNIDTRKTWQQLGGERGVPYFYFRGMIPQIELDETLGPSFYIKTTLQRFPNPDKFNDKESLLVSNETIKIRAVVYDSKTNKEVGNKTVDIGESFEKEKDYEFKVKIEEDWIKGASSNYYIRLFGVATGNSWPEGWEGKTFISTITTPSFKAGALQYAKEKTIYMSADVQFSKLIPPLSVFNPSFERDNLTLELINVTGITSEERLNTCLKIEIKDSKDGSNFILYNKTPGAENIMNINLGIIEERKLDILATWLCPDWIGKDQTVKLSLIASIPDKEDSDLREPTTIEYNIEMSKEETCSRMENFGSCLGSNFCSWNITGGGTSPPKQISGGNCISCGLFAGAVSHLGCINYNNNESCIVDKCGLATEIEGSCSWNNNENKCLITIGGCQYENYWVKECDGSVEEGILGYKLVSGDPDSCESPENKSVQCENIRIVPFFDVLRIFGALIIILIVYGLNHSSNLCYSKKSS